MQTLLNDIELDVQELKYLLQAVSAERNPALRIVAKRNIRQMKTRLDALQRLLDRKSAEEMPVVETPVAALPDAERPVAGDKVIDQDAAQSPVVFSSSILAERIKPSTDLRHAISLNDSFRFVRELFGGDAAKMNAIVVRLNEASSLDKAIEIFTSEVRPDEENEAAVDFMELLKKYFS
ncbi:hypothetical protein [Bacteroides heparinolyticus]|uniref:hypothetical protein n=1 Tax=Prevotella heparinolytica TaxID=28113 RepID=UPI0028EEEF28|nr:hypothetical protein [Bacteroides heparinolyticus]